MGLGITCHGHKHNRLIRARGSDLIMFSCLSDDTSDGQSIHDVYFVCFLFPFAIFLSFHLSFFLVFPFSPLCPFLFLLSFLVFISFFIFSLVRSSFRPFLFLHFRS